MDKPRMKLDPKKDVCGRTMACRAGSILAANGFRKEASKFHQECSVCGYDEYVVLRAMKKYLIIG